jgi:Fe2+ transport system protein FeoA
MAPLVDVETGKQFRVCRIDAVGDDGVRLKRLGICVGRPIELEQAGDPMVLLVVGARVGLSRQLASKILVVPHTDGDARVEPVAERLIA